MQAHQIGYICTLVVVLRKGACVKYSLKTSVTVIPLARCFLLAAFVICLSHRQAKTFCSISIRSKFNSHQIAGDAYVSRRWVIHPKDPDELIIILDRTIQSYNRHGLEQIMETEDVKLECDTLKRLCITKSVITCLNYLVLQFQGPYGSRLTTGTIMVGHNDMINGNEIQYLIGVTGSRLIYLGHLGWICSSDLDKRDEANYTRHIFVPQSGLAST